MRTEYFWVCNYIVYLYYSEHITVYHGIPAAEPLQDYATVRRR